MKIGIDIDGVITDLPEFFAKLSHLWDDEIIIITYRDLKHREKTIEELKSLNIKYSDLIFVSSFEEKSEVIVKFGISLYFDDQPEFLKSVPDNVSVCLFRNGGNFDFDDRLWMFSQQTAKLLF